jgi:hypothetical protein
VALPNIDPQPASLTFSQAWRVTEDSVFEFLPLPPITFFVATDAPDPSFQWQLSTDGSTTWTNLSNVGVFTGADTAVLNISDPTGLSGHQFRVLVTSTDRSGPQTATSTAATLTIIANPPPRPPASFVSYAVPKVTYDATAFPPL